MLTGRAGQWQIQQAAGSVIDLTVGFDVATGHLDGNVDRCTGKAPGLNCAGGGDALTR